MSNVRPCSNCGTQNNASAAFCCNEACGKMLVQSVTSQLSTDSAQQGYQLPPRHPQVDFPNTQQPGYPPTVHNPGKGLSIAGMVLGIVGLVFTFLFPPIGLICAIVGIVLAIQGKKRTPAGMPDGMAKAGIITSMIALGIAALVAVLFVISLISVGSLFGSLFITPI